MKTPKAAIERRRKALRPRRTPPEQRIRIVQLRREGYTFPQIEAKLELEFPESAARERTIRDIAAELMDESGEWRLIDATAEEAALVPAVLAAEARRSEWRVRAVTRAQAAMIVLVRRAVPRLSPERALPVADYFLMVRSIDMGGLEADMERDLEITLGAMAAADDPDAIAERLAVGGLDSGLRAVRDGA